jgi:hypothetical protein
MSLLDFTEPALSASGNAVRYVWFRYDFERSIARCAKGLISEAVMGVAAIAVALLLIVAGPAMLWIAIPRKGELVRPFLRSELAQTLYALTLIIAPMFGVVILLTALSTSS